MFNSYNKTNNKIDAKNENIRNKSKKLSNNIGAGSEESKNKKNKLIYYPEDFDKLDINPRERTDDVNVKWK